MEQLQLECQNLSRTKLNVIDITVYFSELFAHTVRVVSAGRVVSCPVLTMPCGGDQRVDGYTGIRMARNSGGPQSTHTHAHTFSTIVSTSYDNQAPVLFPTGQKGFIGYVNVSGDGNVAVSVGETKVIAKFVGLEKDLATIMPPDRVTCKTTPEADNCRFIGGGSEMTMTCTVTPQGETDSGEKVFSWPSGTLAIVNVNGKILQDVLTS